MILRVPIDMKEKIILLVEDSENDVFLTRRASDKLDSPHRLLVAEDGAKALEYLFEHKFYSELEVCPLPDIVLLDLKLPKIGGLEVLKKIRSDERTRLLPVLIVTASDEKADVTAVNQLGGTSYTVKPVEARQYRETIQKLVSAYLS